MHVRACVLKVKPLEGVFVPVNNGAETVNLCVGLLISSTFLSPLCMCVGEYVSYVCVVADVNALPC